MDLANALGYPMHYDHPAQIMDEIASLTPTFTGVSYARLDALGSIQWPCNAAHPEGTPTMHVEDFPIGLGQFAITDYVASDELSNRRFPLLLTTGRILSQYNVGAQTRRTHNQAWHDEDVLELHPADAELRGVRDGRLGRHHQPRRPDGTACADQRPHAAGGGLHYLPPSGQRGQRDHHRQLRLGDQLSGIQGDRRAGREGQPAIRLAAPVPDLRPAAAAAAARCQGRSGQTAHSGARE
jgi:anaerobic selenocysteine-containing dehydrogenase